MILVSFNNSDIGRLIVEIMVNTSYSIVDNISYLMINNNDDDLIVNSWLLNTSNNNCSKP